MDIIEHMERYDYEQVVFCSDKGAGLKAIIAIHDTTLGPALGGTRMWPYSSEEEALVDVLRLARAMTYKNAAAGLNFGGGKAVVIGDPAKDKSEALFRSLGRFVQSLGGRYITTEDVGTSVRDMQFVRAETSFVTGLPLSWGSSGDPSPVTAFGVLQAMKACAGEVYGSDSLEGRRVAIQGVGKVGHALARVLHEEKAALVVSDTREEAARVVRGEVGAAVLPPDEIYDAECDIFSPCALGAVLNDDIIPRLKCRIIAGAANNQLAEERHCQELARRGILYAPDFVVSAGGVINLSFELICYDAEASRAKTAEIYDTVKRIIATAKAEGITTAEAANHLAEDRLRRARGIKGLYLRR